MILGGNDAAIGALIPYIEAYYHIDYTTVSLIFLSPVCGYVASSMMNNAIHMKFGQRGIAMAMGVCHTVAYLLVCLHIPYPALVFVFILGGFGNGLGDSAWSVISISRGSDARDRERELTRMQERLGRGYAEPQ